MRPIVFFVAMAGLAVAGSIPACADEIADAIEQGRTFYQSGNLAAAKQALDLASQLIGQKTRKPSASSCLRHFRGGRRNRCKPRPALRLASVPIDLKAEMTLSGPAAMNR